MNDLSGQVHLAELSSIPLAVIRRTVSRTELSATVRELCGTVFLFARSRGLVAGRNVAVYLDGAITLEVGVELPEAFSEQDGVVHSATPAGLTASVTLIGPYSLLGAAHGAIRDWCQANGYRTVGANWEIYGHWQPEWNDNPSLIRTDVFHRVERIAT